MTKLDRRAADIVERSWPEAEDDANRRRLARQVKGQLERNSVHPSGWSWAKKLRRSVLRDRKQLCRDKFLGKRVQFEYQHRTREGRVEDVRISDGNVVYILDTSSREFKRSWISEWEVLD